MTSILIHALHSALICFVPCFWAWLGASFAMDEYMRAGLLHCLDVGRDERGRPVLLEVAEMVSPPHCWNAHIRSRLCRVVFLFPMYLTLKILDYG